MIAIKDNKNLLMVKLGDIGKISISTPGSGLSATGKEPSCIPDAACISIHAPLNKDENPLETDFINISVKSNEVNIYPEYLEYFLQYRRKQYIKPSMKGDHVSLNHLLKVTLPLPSLNTQQVIVKSLDNKLKQINRQILSGKKELAGLKKERDLFFERKFKQLRTKKIYRLQDTGQVKFGKTLNSSMKKYFGYHTPFYNHTCLTEGLYTGNPFKYLSEQGARISKPCKAGSVIVCFSGSKFGKAALLTDTASISGQLFSITPHETILPEFLLYQITGPVFQQKLLEAAFRETIKKNALINLQVEIPSLRKQKETLPVLRQATELYQAKAEKLQTDLKKAEDLRKQLFEDVFVGMITSRQM